MGDSEIDYMALTWPNITGANRHWRFQFRCAVHVAVRRWLSSWSLVAIRVGEVTGGGTQMDKNKKIEWVGIECNLQIWTARWSWCVSGFASLAHQAVPCLSSSVVTSKCRYRFTEYEPRADSQLDSKARTCGLYPELQFRARFSTLHAAE